MKLWQFMWMNEGGSRENPFKKFQSMAQIKFLFANWEFLTVLLWSGSPTAPSQGELLRMVASQERSVKADFTKVFFSLGEGLIPPNFCADTHSNTEESKLGG